MATSLATPNVHYAADVSETLRQAQFRLDALHAWVIELDARIDVSHQVLKESYAALRWASTTARFPT